MDFSSFNNMSEFTPRTWQGHHSRSIDSILMLALQQEQLELLAPSVGGSAGLVINATSSGPSATDSTRVLTA
jgi:hypothetical protein